MPDSMNQNPFKKKFLFFIRDQRVKVCFKLFLIFLAIYGVEFGARQIMLTVNRFDIRLDQNLLRSFHSDLIYHIRYKPFGVKNRYYTFGKSKLPGYISFDEKEGLLRSSEGDHFLNSRGFRGPYFEDKPDPNIFRIMVVGDSTSAGTYENTLTYPRVLERILNFNKRNTQIQYQVINTAHWGYTSCQIKKLYKKELANLEPDLIIFSSGFIEAHGFQFFMEQANKNTPVSCAYISWENVPFKIGHTSSYMLLEWTIKSAKLWLEKNFPFSIPKQKSLDVSKVSINNYMNDSISNYKKNIKEILDHAHKKGIPVGLFKQPSMFEDTTPFLEQRQYPQLSEYTSEQIETFINFLSRFDRLYQGLSKEYDNVFYIRNIGVSSQTKNKKLFFHDWIHPTGSGNRILAYEIYNAISSKLKSDFAIAPVKTKEIISEDQFEIEYLKSLFATNKIEDLSYPGCVSIHKHCTHVSHNVPDIEYLTSSVEFTLGSILQFKEQMKDPVIFVQFKKFLLDAIKIEPKFSLPYWALGQLYLINQKQKFGNEYLQKSYLLNPLLKFFSFQENYDQFIKNHSPNPLFTDLKDFLSVLQRAPNYKSAYNYFWSIKGKKLTKENIKSHLPMYKNLYYVAPSLAKSLFLDIVEQSLSLGNNQIAKEYLSILKFLKPGLNKSYNQVKANNDIH
jgi:hypothetical protein